MGKPRKKSEDYGLLWQDSGPDGHDLKKSDGEQGHFEVSSMKLVGKIFWWKFDCQVGHSPIYYLFPITLCEAVQK